jgi:hypothetical protein
MAELILLLKSVFGVHEITKAIAETNKKYIETPLMGELNESIKQIFSKTSGIVSLIFQLII